jgi:hypothetical protein
MVKRFIVGCVAVISFAYAGETNIQAIDAYKVGYTDGYEKGVQDGEEKGHKKAVEEFKKVYEEKLKEYKEIEAGKLLLKEHKISYPRVYQIQTPNGSKIVVEGCRVIQPYDDLLGKIPFRGESSENQNQSQLIQREKDTYKLVKVKVDRKYEDLIRNSGYAYYKSVDSDELNVYLENEKTKKELCKKIQCK